MSVDGRQPAGVGQPAPSPSPSPVGHEPVQGPGDEARRLTAAINDARCADGAAFDQLYRALHPGLLRYLRVWVGDDAEDVASETWLQIARDLGSFHGDWDRFRGWAVTIARHRAVDHARHRQRHPDLPLEHLPERPSPLDTAETALAAIGTDAAVTLLARLPREQAEAILLRVVFALDAKSCGNVLGRRAGAVRTAAHRGLRELAGLLNADHAPDQGRPDTLVPRQRRGRSLGGRTPAVTPAAGPTQLG